MRLPPRLGNWVAGQSWRGQWITFYNHQRPHAAHGGQPPAVVYFNGIETDQQARRVAETSRESVQASGSTSPRGVLLRSMRIAIGGKWQTTSVQRLLSRLRRLSTASNGAAPARPFASSCRAGRRRPAFRCEQERKQGSCPWQSDLADKAALHQVEQCRFNIWVS